MDNNTEQQGFKPYKLSIEQMEAMYILNVSLIRPNGKDTKVKEERILAPSFSKALEIAMERFHYSPNL